MRSALSISILVALLTAFGCSSVSQNGSPANAASVGENVVEQTGEAANADALDAADGDENAESTEAADSDETDAADDAEASKSDETDADGAQNREAQEPPAADMDKSAAFKEVGLPICDFWRHGYGVDSNMTKDKCRLSDKDVNLLIQSGSDVNQQNDYGQTPIMLVDSAKAVKALIEAGADVNHCDEFGKTALDYASSGKIVDLIVHAKGFALQGASLNGYNGHADVAMALEKYGLLPSPLDLEQYVILFITALYENALEGVQYYLDKILYSEKDLSEQIISDAFYSTISVSSGIEPVKDSAKIAGPKSENATNKRHLGSLISRINASSPLSANVIKLLNDKGFSVEASQDNDSKAAAGTKAKKNRSRYGKPLKTLSESAYKKAERHVMSYNQTQFSDGDDATGHWTRDSSILRSWLNQGGDPNMRDAQGNTPLMFADFANEVRILVAAGADVNARDDKGNTVLMVQLKSYIENSEYITGTISIFEALILAGADLCLQNQNGETAFDIYNKNKDKCEELGLSDLEALLKQK